MPDIQVESLVKSYGRDRVLDEVSFTVRDKEFVTLLGPSGCGKTTTLMSIAGFTVPDGGRVACGDRLFVDTAAGIALPPERRELGIVFQSYAIWPHMTVAENVGFPLRIRHAGKQATRARVTELLDLVELGAHARRYPYQLSGGQQQRVALARALACSPDVLLLDEPFSNLDAQLRERARAWLRDLQRALGLTTIFVTHDQDEALSMSDRIMVMRGGRILHAGTPEEIYHKPADRFTAEFVGRCAFVSGTVRHVGDGHYTLITPDFPDGIAFHAETAPPDGAEATLALRPEHIEVSQTDDGWEATIEHVSFLGDRYHYRVRRGGQSLTVQTHRRLDEGTIHLTIPPGAPTLVPDASPEPSHDKETPHD
jgi:iron(III) transport system ATP-binding protein